MMYIKNNTIEEAALLAGLQKQPNKKKKTWKKNLQLQQNFKFNTKIVKAVDCYMLIFSKTTKDLMNEIQKFVRKLFMMWTRWWEDNLLFFFIFELYEKNDIFICVSMDGDGNYAIMSIFFFR